jgi:hypothetical protein
VLRDWLIDCTSEPIDCGKESSGSTRPQLSLADTSLIAGDPVVPSCLDRGTEVRRLANKGFSLVAEGGPTPALLLQLVVVNDH